MRLLRAFEESQLVLRDKLSGEYIANLITVCGGGGEEGYESACQWRVYPNYLE